MRLVVYTMQHSRDEHVLNVEWSLLHALGNPYKQELHTICDNVVDEIRLLWFRLHILLHLLSLCRRCLQCNCNLSNAHRVCKTLNNTVQWASSLELMFLLTMQDDSCTWSPEQLQMAVGLPLEDLTPPEEPEGSTMARAESAGSPGVALCQP